MTVRRPRPTQTTQQLANLSYPYPKAARDWGYPRTSPRPWHNTNQPDNTLSSNLTAFFGRTARNPNNTLASRMQGSRETELFKSGARQVEDAVTALGERRQELQRDVCQLEVSLPLSAIPVSLIERATFCNTHTKCWGGAQLKVLTVVPTMTKATTYVFDSTAGSKRSTSSGADQALEAPERRRQAFQT